ncbi:MAG: hypothetical protein EXS36_07285 [Pedosphaera sp.]|nr:hypothetical protein [Pedosphaera sp.]
MARKETSPNIQHGGDDDQSWLYPKYISNLKIFICPSTQNFIRTTNFIRRIPGDDPVLKDLTEFAFDKKSPGTSYEILGWWGNSSGLDGPDAQKTLSNVQSWVYQYPSSFSFAAGYKGTGASPSQAWLFMDGDDGEQGTRNNIPDPIDHHGADGGGVSFCDGHVEFVSSRPTSNYILRLYLGADSDP